jgi:hypothetical protein
MRERYSEIERILQLGYYVVEYSSFHYRIQDAVDFWPTTGSWFDRKGEGSRRSRQGHGSRALFAYLKEHYPIDRAM